jgi:hypothetical protein
VTSLSVHTHKSESIEAGRKVNTSCKREIEKYLDNSLNELFWIINGSYTYKLICTKQNAQNSPEIFYERKLTIFLSSSRLFLRENILRHQRHFKFFSPPRCLNLRQNVFAVVAQSRAVFLFLQGRNEKKIRRLSVYTDAGKSRCQSISKKKTFCSVTFCCTREALHNLCGLSEFFHSPIVLLLRNSFDDFCACICTIVIESRVRSRLEGKQATSIFGFFFLKTPAGMMTEKAVQC